MQVFFHKSSAVGKPVQEAGPVALIAYADRENPDRVFVKYLLAFSSCPTRSTGLVGPRGRADPIFFRPACPPWQ